MEDEGLDDPIEPEDLTEVSRKSTTLFSNIYSMLMKISDKRKSANTHKKKNLKKTASNQRKVAKKQVSNCTDLLSRVFSTMDKHKEVNYYCTIDILILIQIHINYYPLVRFKEQIEYCQLRKTKKLVNPHSYKIFH